MTTSPLPLPSLQPLQPLTFPLHGSRLIEASAGTGKTWTIAALYVRLVLGHARPDADGPDRAETTASTEAGAVLRQPLKPSEILVMTFTRAATRELSDRIRSRLLQAARHFRAGAAPDGEPDDFLADLLADYPDPVQRQNAAWLLATAADNMDDAAIFTIDAWCQRMLREHAFDSGSVFDETLVADEHAIFTTAVQDYWRRECYPLSGAQLESVLQLWPGVDALQADMAALLAHQAHWPPSDTRASSLAEELEKSTAGLAELLSNKARRVRAMRRWLLDEQLANNAKHWNGRSLSVKIAARWFEALTQWAQLDLPLLLPDIGKGTVNLTPDGLLDLRKAAAPAMSHSAIPPDFGWFEQVVACYQAAPWLQALRLHAARWVQQRMQQLKRQAGEFGFADLLQRLRDALHGNNATRLRQRILAQYPAALIDEFQDTSALQYELFDAIYRVADNVPQHALLLIGDPKQSIYRFRGADIYSYLRARCATAGRHYVLETNYRSTQAVVQAVNTLFGYAEKAHPQAAFRFRPPGAPEGTNPLPFWPVQAKGRSEQFVSRGAAVPALTLVHDWAEPRAGDAVRARFAEHCAEQVVAWLNDPGTGLEEKGEPFRRLCPRDLAILVRTGKEAAAVRRALQRRRVASVYLSDRESVFHSPEAHDLWHWLRGVATPQDAVLVRAALATATIGLTLEELAWLSSNDEAFDAHCEQMRQLRQIWQTQGVLTMLRQALHRFGLAARWLASPDGQGERRLTNFLHLAELLQAASAELEGEHALIRWLQLKSAEAAQDSDEQVVRLESDADLVKIVTIHKSKGLEYPVVLLPFATLSRPVDKKTARVLALPDGDGQPVLQFNVQDDDIDQADTERLREDLRLLYVALTRARHAVWVGFASVKVGNGKECQAHRSALGYLVGGGVAHPHTAWAPLWKHLEQQSGATIALSAAAGGTIPCTDLQRPDARPDLCDAPAYRADFDRDWSVASYSRLTRATHDPSARPLALARRAEDEWLPPAPGQAEPSGQIDPEAPDTLAPVADAPWPPLAQTVRPPQAALPIQHRLPAGRLSGNFVHDQLEWLLTELMTARPPAADTAPAWPQWLQQRCERAGYTEQASELVEWLQQVVNTPLPQLGAPLAQIRHGLPEMEFWLPAHALHTQRLDELCREHIFAGLPRPALQKTQLHGMVMGFADLVFQHGGRYWVLDYKSSRLGLDDDAYTLDAMRHDMVLRRYDVQALLYQFALHRLLAQRLGAAYDPAQHLGGALYLFVRGIARPGTHGLCWVSPSLAALQGLQAMLAPAPHDEPEATGAPA